MRRPAYAAELESTGGMRIESLMELRSDPCDGEVVGKEEWKVLFEGYLIQETRENFSAVIEYLIGHKDLEECYNDILAVLEDWPSNGIVAMLGIVLQRSFRAEDFEKIMRIVYTTSAEMFLQDRGRYLAYVLLGICRKGEHLPQRKLTELQDFIYSARWPPYVEMQWLLLRMERQLNRLLPGQRDDFAKSVPRASEDGTLEQAIENERMLILDGLDGDDRVSLRTGCYWDLPYLVRHELGDGSEIEPDLISIIARNILRPRPVTDQNVIILTSESDPAAVVAVV